MNIDNIKKEFPIFNNKVHNNDLVYLDSANSSQKPQVVIDRIYDFYSKEFSNVGRSVHYLAVAATNMYESTRSSVQKYINAKDANEIVFTKGATEAINLVANSYVRPLLQPNDQIIITEMEHHANIVPWQIVCKEKEAELKILPMNSKGELIVDELEKIITKLKISPKHLVRFKENKAKELGISVSDSLTYKQWMKILTKNPELIERPIVVTSKGAVIGRPPENVLKVLD